LVGGAELTTACKLGIVPDAGIDGIRDRLAMVRELDPKLRIFGADRHRYQLAPPIDAARLAEVGARFGVALPDGYRAFVTELGDGGAGPYWGLHPLATGVEGLFAGGYGKCGPGCKLGEYCGDGVVQAAQEDCDDGVNIGSPCPSGCHILIVE
jgi:hypothetical protein